MPLTSGARLGPYEILAPVGAGGMGEVYKARDTRLDRTVAIKVLHAHVASDPDFRQRFEREARAAAALNHPHICTLHDIGHHEGIDFLVMEYCDGETLAARLATGRCRSTRRSSAPFRSPTLLDAIICVAASAPPSRHRRSDDVRRRRCGWFFENG